MKHHKRPGQHAAPGADIPNFLRITTAMIDRMGRTQIKGYNSLDHFVLRNGRHMNRVVSPGAVGLPMMQRRMCFMNAANVALRHTSRFIYCEGYAHTGAIPVLHAWLIDRQGRTIDPTWGLEGTEYFGVAIRREFLRSKLFESETYGLLDCPSLKWPLLNCHPKEWRHEIMDKMFTAPEEAAVMVGAGI